MKKQLAQLLILLLLSTATAFAQTKTSSKLGTGSSKLSKTDSLMCGKEWHVTSVEEWGVAAKPTERNVNDMLMMTTDMKFTLVLFGSKKSGTWSRAGQYLYFTDEATKQKISYKVLTVEPNKIKVDHYSDEEGHSIFEMESK